MPTLTLTTMSAASAAHRRGGLARICESLDEPVRRIVCASKGQRGRNIYIIGNTARIWDSWQRGGLRLVWDKYFNRMEARG